MSEKWAVLHSSVGSSALLVSVLKNVNNGGGENGSFSGRSVLIWEHICFVRGASLKRFSLIYYYVHNYTHYDYCIYSCGRNTASY